MLHDVLFGQSESKQLVLEVLIGEQFITDFQTSENEFGRGFGNGNDGEAIVGMWFIKSPVRFGVYFSTNDTNCKLGDFRLLVKSVTISGCEYY